LIIYLDTNKNMQTGRIAKIFQAIDLIETIKIVLFRASSSNFCRRTISD